MDYNYQIGVDMDGYFHIFKVNLNPPFSTTNIKEEACELSWQGLFVRVRPRVFYNWIEKPREVGDEFDLFGQKWLVVDRWYDRDELICTRADAVGYRLLLHNLIWKTEMRVMLREWWISIPMRIWDVINRDPELDKNIIELRKQFRAERGAPFIYYS